MLKEQHSYFLCFLRVWGSNQAAHPCLSVVPVIAMHQADDTLGHTTEVEDGRVGVKAGGMELVTVLHG